MLNLAPLKTLKDRFTKKLVIVATQRLKSGMMSKDREVNIN